MIQSIASMAVQMQQEMFQAEASTRVAKLTLDTARAQGDAVVEMMNAQAELYSHLGSKVNVLA